MSVGVASEELSLRVASMENTSVLRTELRRGIGPFAGLGAAVLLFFHLGFRPWDWTNEWRLVAWQYAFSIVMIGPIGAGFAAWSATVVRKQGAGAVASGRITRALALSIGSVYLWIVGALAVGALFVVMLTIVKGPPGVPELQDFLPFVLAALSLFMYCAVGALAGWRAPHILTAPVTAACTFAVTVALYGTSFFFLVDIGGSSGSLLGLTPNLGLQLLQALLFSVAGLACLTNATRDPYRPPSEKIVARTLSMAAVVIIILGASSSPERLTPTTTDVMACKVSPGGVSVCLGQGYADLADGLLAALDGPVSKLEEAGVDAPKAFDQRFSTPGAAPVDIGLPNQGPTAAAQTVAGSFLSRSCDLYSEPGILDTLGYLSWWLSPEDSDRDTLWRPQYLPVELRSGTIDEQHEWVRQAVSKLSACG